MIDQPLEPIPEPEGFDHFSRSSSMPRVAIEGDPFLPTTELLQKVLITLSENTELRNELFRIRRWHAYYETPENRDTNGLGHALNTLNITKELTRHDVMSGMLTPDQASDLCITALIHDLGEIQLGNATYGGKSQEHEKKEYVKFLEILDRDFSGLLPAERDSLKTLFKDVAFGDKKNDLMAKYFNMIEVTGYTNFGVDMFWERPPGFAWEVLSWRILAYHLFRTEEDGSPKDIPAYCVWSEGNQAFWSERLHKLDLMVQHFEPKNQELWLATDYDRLDLPDRTTVKPIDFSRWKDIRDTIFLGTV